MEQTRIGAPLDMVLIVAIDLASFGLFVVMLLGSAIGLV